MAAILIVDDEETIRSMFERILGSDGHDCQQAEDAITALAALDATRFDLVLCDVNMPGTNGVDLARAIAGSRPTTAVLMVTAQDDPGLAGRAFEAGAYGYVVKPVKSNALRIHVDGALRRRQLELTSRADRLQLEDTVRGRTDELVSSVRRLANAEGALLTAEAHTIEHLRKAAEYRDNETGQHIERMSRYAAVLARRAGFEVERAEALRIASPMHDVGKIGIPDHILLKPGKHTVEEFAVMQTHAEIGHQILSGSGSALLDLAALVAWTHHERFDGTGYPRRLAGEAIPIEGRIVAIADVFDALLTRRCYKPAFPVEKSVAIMRESSGGHFDPGLCGLFLSELDELLEIRERFADQGDGRPGSTGSG